MKSAPQTPSKSEEEDLKEMTLFEFVKGYFIYLYRFYIRP